MQAKGGRIALDGHEVRNRPVSTGIALTSVLLASQKDSYFQIYKRPELLKRTIRFECQLKRKVAVGTIVSYRATSTHDLSTSPEISMQPASIALPPMYAPPPEIYPFQLMLESARYTGRPSKRA